MQENISENFSKFWPHANDDDDDDDEGSNAISSYFLFQLF